MRSAFSLLTVLFLLTCTNLFSQQISDVPALGENPFNLMQFVTTSTGWVVGRNGLIRKTIDGGAHWSDQFSGVSAELFSLSFVDPARGWVCGRGGVILSTTDGGATWQQQESGTQRLCRTIRFIDIHHGWIGCEDGFVLATTNGGTSWTLHSTPSTATLLSLAFPSTENGFATTSDGVLLKTTNGGTSWTSMITDPALIPWGIAFGDAVHGCIVASDHDYNTGTIFSTTDGGATWAGGKVSSSGMFTVQLFANNSGWATGRYGTVLKTSDGGNSWFSVGTSAYWLCSLSFIDMYTGWAMDAAGHVVKTTNGGSDWMPQSLLLKPEITASSRYMDAINGRLFFEKSDKKLNDVYQELLLARRFDQIFISNLRASERIWIQFRDAQLTLKYPIHPSIDKGDPLPWNQAIYLAHLTDDRTNDLLEWLSAPRSRFSDYRIFDNNGYTNGSYGYNQSVVYVSDLRVIRSGDIQGGIGIDKPYWVNELVIGGRQYRKGVVMYPEDGGKIAYAEFLLPRKGGRLLGVAGWAEKRGAFHQGKMRFRILVDGELLYGRQLSGKESQNVDLDLGLGKILRIETDDGFDGNEADHMAFGDLRILY
jgi:photosystem II stability/assembly factor-like uncharacterized protein/uncharacterized protein YecT (DUF1311 family)